MKRLVTLFLCLMHFALHAQWIETPLVSPPTRGLKMAPAIYNSTLLTPGTSGAANTDDWYIAQWSNAYPLGAFNGQNMVQSASSRIVYAPNNIEMALNSDKTLCDPAKNSVNVETNLFAAPNVTVVPGTYVTGPFLPAINNLQGFGAAHGSLAGNGEIVHSLSVRVKYFKQVPYDTRCVTQGSFITSFVLKNKLDHQYTLFYQLPLTDVPVTPARPAQKFWFFKALNGYTWGYDDTLSSYYQTPATKVGQTINFTANIKPRLRQVVLDPANELPAHMKNPDDWYIEGLYYGPHNWGGIVSTYVASNFKLTYRRYCLDPKRLDCLE